MTTTTNTPSNSLPPGTRVGYLHVGPVLGSPDWTQAGTVIETLGIDCTVLWDDQTIAKYRARDLSRLDG